MLIVALADDVGHRNLTTMRTRTIRWKVLHLPHCPLDRCPAEPRKCKLTWFELMLTKYRPGLRRSILRRSDSRAMTKTKTVMAVTVMKTRMRRKSRHLSLAPSAMSLGACTFFASFHTLGNFHMYLFRVIFALCQKNYHRKACSHETKIPSKRCGQGERRWVGRRRQRCVRTCRLDYGLRFRRGGGQRGGWNAGRVMPP